MVTSSNIKSEIKLWLEIALKAENVKNLSINIEGNSEKGDGYMGDIVFVTATGQSEDGSTKVYNLVLKCSKRSQALREISPVQEAFLTEIAFYDKIIPCFMQFQKEKGIQDPFDSVPKFYGSFTGENMEILVFENLKESGYELWPKRQPLTRKHIEMVVKEYGRFHATSVALKHQRPTEFQKLVESLGDTMGKFIESGDLNILFGSPIDEVYELLKDDMDETVILKWKSLKEKIDYVFTDLNVNFTGLKVIIHGDCWNNNFMHLHKNGNHELPLKVAMLDWQIARYDSPIYDLSYFLFACISEDDLENLDDILAIYYKSFTDQLKRLDMPDSDKIYPFEQFLNEWKIYSICGIFMVNLIMKVCSTEKDEVVDIVEAAEKGIDLSRAFVNEIRDKNGFKNRIRPIIEYVVKKDLI